MEVGVVQDRAQRFLLRHPHPRPLPARGRGGRAKPYAAFSFLAFSWASSMVPTM